MRTRTFYLAGLLVVAAVVVLAAFASSARPDGLERVAEDLGLGSPAAVEVAAWRAPVGLGLVALLAGGAAWLVRGRDGGGGR